jgi:hypothetical protein
LPDRLSLKQVLKNIALVMFLPIKTNTFDSKICEVKRDITLYDNKTTQCKIFNETRTKKKKN